MPAENKSVAFDLSALGDVLDQQIGGGGNDKPFLQSLTKATLKEFSLNRQEDIRENRKKQDSSQPPKKFYAITLRTKIEYMYDNGDGNGEQLYTSYDNYSGLRAYPKLDESGEPVLDANGNPVIERFWAGNAEGNYVSYFSLLLKAAQDFDDSIKTYQDFFKFLSQERQCLIRSEQTGFGNQDKKTKQVIKEFI